MRDLSSDFIYTWGLGDTFKCDVDSTQEPVKSVHFKINTGLDSPSNPFAIVIIRYLTIEQRMRQDLKHDVISTFI